MHKGVGGGVVGDVRAREMALEWGQASHWHDSWSAPDGAKPLVNCRFKNENGLPTTFAVAPPSERWFDVLWKFSGFSHNVSSVVNMHHHARMQINDPLKCPDFASFIGSLFRSHKQNCALPRKTIGWQAVR